LVSIQLVSPASGDGAKTLRPLRWTKPVSIQLVSPASGDAETAKLKVELKELFPFN